MQTAYDALTLAAIDLLRGSGVPAEEADCDGHRDDKGRESLPYTGRLEFAAKYDSRGLLHRVEKAAEVFRNRMDPRLFAPSFVLASGSEAA